ncbi:protein FAM193A isoform X3 [Calonectris borealis]|uniref:protein FAM193A isoform X3 n=1 Tax=Calonectris borealis TaxID=1323832 RepID=UPI003F4B8233
MSPADAKRGAKRRKNKRGGGLSSTGGPGPSGGGGAGGLGKAGAAAGAAPLRAATQAAAASPSAVGGLLTAPATAAGNGALGGGGAAAGHGEVSLNGTQFTDSSVGSEFTGVSQTPFTFGLGQRAPYTTGEHCLLCRSERKDTSLSESGIKNSSKTALSTSPKANNMLHLPLWVCPDCRRTVEKEERHATIEQSLVSQDFLLHMPLGNSGSQQESVGGGRITVGAQTVPAADLSNSSPSDIACNCEACNERRENSAEPEREPQQLQNYWSEVRYMVRCIYRQAGTPLADDQDQSLVPDKEGMKELVDRLGTTHDSCSEDMYSTLLQRYHQLEQEMGQVAEAWLECQKRIDDYVDEQMAMKTKQRMLKEDWEFFKQRRFIEEQLNNKKALAGENNFTDTMRHMLSSRLSMPDCPNCNYRRRCTCDDCSLSHILTCGIMDSPITDDIHINQLPLQIDSAPDYLSEIRPPSMSSASSGSGSSSPITIQQHPRLILADNGSAPTFGSDDEDVAPLSAKFADIYPLNNYDDAEVVANMNGIHSELNGGGENMALKDESPQVSSTSSSSSEADDEEADGESSGEPPGTQKEEMSLGKRALRKDEAKMDSPPPSYPSQQADQGPNACECHVCKQEASGLTASALATGRLPAGHQFMNPEKPAHPALHLYPHIHGHIPLHTIPHLPRPLIHPTLYTASPFTHNKALPPAPVQNHTNKHQVFNASLQDHIYPSCFGSTPDWNSSKFISLWGSEMMNDKNWNPATFLPDTIPGSDILAPALSEIRPEALPTTSSNEATAVTDSKEKKNAAKKKCLYNFQDAFMEANKVVMATSSATSSVSCTATTVQSSSNQFKVSSKRPSSIGEVFHNINKEDHRHSAPVAPRNSPTSLASLPSLSPAALSPASTPHLPNLAAPSFPKTAATAPGFVDPHSGLCPTTVAPPTSTTDSSVSAPPSVCSDPDCEGHRCENSNTYDHQQYDGEESQDEDSCSEHSSSTSTSTNQKEGKYCDCCYCEFFGHGGPPAAPTSRNYAEMREKLRLRLTKRKEEQPKKPDQISERESVVDHRKVEDLLQFINSSETKPVSSSRAAKRARHKQRKLEEKARLEAEAREREHHQLLEEQRRREEEEEERLKQELQRLQELQQLRAVKKKKKERTSKDCQKVDLLTRNCQAVKESVPNASEDIQNGTLEQSEKIETSSGSLSRHMNHTEQRPVSETGCELSNPVNTRDSKLLYQKEGSVKQHEPLSFLLDIMHQHKEGNSKQKLKQINKPCAEQVKKPVESPKAAEIQTKTRNQIESKAKATELPTLAEPKKEEKKLNNNNKKQLNHVKEEKAPVTSESPSPSEQQQNNKLILADSPQPKGKNKKNKKKKGDKVNNSIDDVFLPKDIDLDSVEMDETEREVEYFKRFCLDSARQTRQRLSINWSNFSLKKTTFAAH